MPDLVTQGKRRLNSHGISLEYARVPLPPYLARTVVKPAMMTVSRQAQQPLTQLPSGLRSQSCDFTMFRGSGRFEKNGGEIPFTGRYDPGMDTVDDRGHNFSQRPLNLEATTIRLIEVLNPGLDDTIRCKMRIITVENMDSMNLTKPTTTLPAYICLSYVWGLSDDTQWITMDDKPFKVRKNLWEFLQVLSSWKAQGYKTEPVEGTSELNFELCTQSLWADALCIDQSNVSERNHQVQQMGWIYSNASQVVSWLGNEPEIAALLHSAVAKKPFTENLPYPDRLRVIYRLTGHEYWKRAWITQEIYLARDLYLMSQTVSAPVSALARLEDPIANLRHYPHYRPLKELNARLAEKKDSLTLIQNLWLHRHKQCCNPRDRAYSLLSLSTDGGRLRVNYGSSINALAREVLRLYNDNLCLCKVMVVFDCFQLAGVARYPKASDSALLLIAANGFPSTFRHLCNILITVRKYYMIGPAGTTECRMAKDPERREIRNIARSDSDSDPW